VETNQETCGQSLEVHQSVIDAIVADEGNIIKQGEVSVHIMTLAKEDPFDFDSVQHLPLSVLVEEFPLVLEMIYQEGSDKCFVRVKADLNFYDGVSALHTGFNLLEYLDTTNTSKAISPYPFTASNPPYPITRCRTFRNNWADYVMERSQLGSIRSIGWESGNTRLSWRHSKINSPNDRA
jgi:hypothetical protein